MRFIFIYSERRRWGDVSYVGNYVIFWVYGYCKVSIREPCEDKILREDKKIDEQR